MTTANPLDFSGKQHEPVVTTNAANPASSPAEQNDETHIDHPADEVWAGCRACYHGVPVPGEAGQNDETEREAIIERTARALFARTKEGRDHFTWPLNGERDRQRDLADAERFLTHVFGGNPFALRSSPAATTREWGYGRNGTVIHRGFTSRPRYPVDYDVFVREVTAWFPVPNEGETP